MRVVTSPTRRVAAAIAFVLLVLSQGVPAFSITEQEVEQARQEREAAARGRAAALTNLDDAVASYEALNSELQTLTFRMGRIREQIADYERQSSDLRDQIRQRAVESYMNGDQRDPIARIFSPEQIQQSLIAQEVINQAVESDSAALDTLTATTAEMERLKTELQADTDRVSDLRVEADAVLSRMNELFDAAQVAFDQASTDLTTAQAALAEQKRREEEAARAAAEAQRKQDEIRAAAGAPALGVPLWVTPGMICPVAGPTSFIDTWGAPRSGGRIHVGTDMFAPKHTPLVAVAGGTIHKGYNSLGGNVVRLFADYGVSFLYAHMDAPSFLNEGQRVSQGDVIGYVGDTGDPPPGAYHLHFQIEPSGIPVNPYPTVLAVCP
jgi:murein DD-endopeptidase MepM/ murein hydrolase activator NlpD